MMRSAKLLFLAALASFVLAAFCSVENPDIYYYMGCVRLLLDGKIPFLDFNIAYTPLSFYMASLPASIFGTGNTAALAYNFFLAFVNAGLLYYLLRKNVQDKALCLFSTAYYLISIFFLDGTCYMLEPYVMFWGLLSLIVQRRDNLPAMFVAGICSFMAFWSKQYGLGFIALNIAFLLLQWARRTEQGAWAKASRMFALLTGFTIAACCMIGLLLMHGATPLSSLHAFSGETYQKLGLIGLLEGYGFLIIAFPFFPVTVWLIAKNFSHFRKETFMVVCLCGIFGFMLSTYVRSYMHYIQLAMPFAILLSAMLLDKYCQQAADCRLVRWYKFTVIVPLAIMLYFDCNFIFHSERRAVNRTASEVARIIPKGTDKVYVSTMLLCIGNINRYGAPMIEKWGMSNGFMEEGEPLREIIMDASCFVIDPAKLEYLRQEEPELLRHIEVGRIQTRIECSDKRFETIVFSNQE